MSDWLHELSLPMMTLVVFGLTYLITFLIYLGVNALGAGDRARSFKAVSAGMLSPLGVIFGLFVAFTAAQVWSDNDRASAAVDHEASALRATLLLAGTFPGDVGPRMVSLIGAYVGEAVGHEWPAMAHRGVDLRSPPQPLLDALLLTLSLKPDGTGPVAAQRDMAASLQTVLDARRQRILVSHAGVNGVKWICLGLQALCALFAIAFVHCDNRLASTLALGLFATGVGASVLLIAAHDRPFIGQLAISPEPLLQVLPQAEKGH